MSDAKFDGFKVLKVWSTIHDCYIRQLSINDIALSIWSYEEYSYNEGQPNV